MKISIVPRFCLLACLVAPFHSALAFSYSLENAGVQQTSIAGSVTETFEDGDPNNSIGTYTSNLQIVSADVYGGAGGAGKYGVLMNSVTTTLKLNQLADSFGLWWSAGDAGNSISLYDQNDALLKTYTLADFGTLPSAYLGNPNGTGNGGESYFYVNFLAQGTERIKTVVLGGGNFESDNHSVHFAGASAPEDGPVASVPEGGSLAPMLGLVFSGMVLLKRKAGA